ncbi:MAG: PD-(D/E)XK nuclease family protein [Woeseiaceae bacterium]|nr:PD-(D/E)XK nuclease family protein [Woeseiaceae bacterium]
MYDRLDEALRNGAQVVTANRRLARLLINRFNKGQIDQGKTAWRRPEIHDWGTWLSVLGDTAVPTAERPVRINTHQSRILWENCLSRELPARDANVGALVRLSREARIRLVDWRVPLAKVGEYARSDDERLFANALNAYVRLLERNAWVDDAGFTQNILIQVLDGDLAPARHLVLVGFTSPSPLVDGVVAALRDRGCRVDFAAPEKPSSLRSIEFLDEAQEYRAAGAWARQILGEDPTRRVAIVVSGLEGKAASVGRLVREGFSPGWQLGSHSVENAVNVSYGRPLAEFPVVSIALSLLTWLTGEPLSAAEVSVLIRSSLVGALDDDARIKTELRLREMPDREWTLDLFSRAFSQTGDSDGTTRWIESLEQAATLLHQRSSLESLAESLDEALAAAGWPGEEPVDSTDFQLLNRWRELLNDFVRLSLVQPEFVPGQAVSRLATMARETVFQAESEGALVNVLGALEASGTEFDDLWVTGLTSRQWPPQARPLSIVSTRLQREYGMPDATPSNTSAYASRSLSALFSSASVVTLSLARFDGDAEQAPSPILPRCESVESAELDPGWFAETLVDPSQCQHVDDDIAPPILDGDTVYGGASTLDRQAYSPFDAFAFGRLGLRFLPRFSSALQPVFRGNLVHDALRRLYLLHPDRRSLATLSEEMRVRQVDEAVRESMAAEFALADPVLRQVLRFEERRIRRLLHRVIDYDVSRQDFEVSSIEEDRVFNFRTLSLKLKADRIDRLDDGHFLILDYKTGVEKKLFTRRELNSFQLVLYSLAFEENVAALGLYNVDSRLVGINGAGKTLDDRETWHKDLAGWTAVALAHLERMIDGDLRINAYQSLRDSRQTGLLSRVSELKRD